MFRRNPLAWLLGSIVGVLAALALYSTGTAPVGPAAASAGDAVAVPTAAPARLRLVSVAPDRLAVDGDRVARQILEVTYTIQEPDKVTTAILRLSSPEAGHLVDMEVPAQASATVQFLVDPREHSVGPEVRFRATCPEGATEWRTMGQLPESPEPPKDGPLRIRNVIPSSIGWNERDRFDPVRMKRDTHVVLTGDRFTDACGIEAEVNRSRVELKDVKYDRKSLQGVLKSADRGDQKIAQRWAELKLLLTGPSAGMATTMKLAFQ